MEEYIKTGKKTGKSSIEQISIVYGAQAVVISVDPRRVYVHDPDDTPHTTIETDVPGPKGEHYCWYQCTVKGGREGRDIDVVQLVQTCQLLGAGEILLNCIDKDGTNSGFDLELIRLVKCLHPGDSLQRGRKSCPFCRGFQKQQQMQLLLPEFFIAGK